MNRLRRYNITKLINDLDNMPVITTTRSLKEYPKLGISRYREQLK